MFEIRIISKLCPPCPPASESGGGVMSPPGPMVAPPMYVDHLAVIDETEEKLIKRLNEWENNTDSSHESQYE